MSHSVSAVLLAAGSAKRIGQLKQLLPLKGKPMVRWSVETLISAGVTDIAVVVGPDHSGIQAALADLPTAFAFNTRAQSDMSDSVRVGLGSARPSSTGVLVALADHPFVSRATVTALLESHIHNPGSIIIPVFGRTKGHPSLFPRKLIDEILQGGTLRDIIKRRASDVSLLNVLDEGVITDIDTIDDYMRACRRAG